MGRRPQGVRGCVTPEGPGRTQAKNARAWGAQNCTFIFAQSILFPTMGPVRAVRDGAGGQGVFLK